MTYSITNVNGRDLKAGVGEPVLGSGVLTLRNHNYSIRLDLEGDTPWTGFEQSGEVRITRAGWLYWYTGAGILIPDQGPQKDFSFNYRNKILTMTIEGYQFRFEKRQ